MTDARDVTVYMVGHAHIDPTWLWRWTEGFEEVRATFRSALNRMNETPEFKFTASSACFYAWVKACDPEMFDAIRVRVREGRWELAGGWWVEPDCNIPCGESFVRQGLYAQRFFEREFGVRARVGFNPDSFGHAGTLPQILKGLGIGHYVYMRPSPGVEMDYPGGTTFRWRANDGSEVLACCLLESYGSRDGEIPERIQRLARNPHLNRGQRHILGFYGVGNHGGGPTKRTIAEILEASRDEAYEARVVFSTLGEFFSAFESEVSRDALPVVEKDLQHHARGCYSVHSEIKRLNRQCEHALMSAERFATAAWLLEQDAYPAKQLQQAWQGVLYNQFHDVLAGTSIPTAYDDSRDELGAVRHTARSITNLAVQRIARTVDTSAPGNTVIVVNPLPWDVKQTVVAPPIVARELTGPLGFVDDAEKPVASQAVRSERIGGTSYAFTAEVPALGYRCLHARSGETPHKQNNTLEAGSTFLENAWWRIEFDRKSGQISRLLDKLQNIEVLARGNVLSCLIDSSDTWSHDVKEYRVEAGEFGGARLDVHELGDVLATVRVTSRWDKSVAEQFVTLYRDTDTIDCEFRINWQQRYTALKLVYGTLIREGAVTCDTAYGLQARPADGTEQPGQKWVDFTGRIDGREYGLAILNDSKYGFDVREGCRGLAGLEGGVMRLTLLRSPAYAHHDPVRYDVSVPYAIIDQGWQTVRVRLVPHAGPAAGARVPRLAWELNEPALVHVESAHPGRRPASGSLLAVEAENVLLTVLKKSEDGEDLIVRGYETDGKAVRTEIVLPVWEKRFGVSFRPHEIKTLRIDPRNWTITEVNLLECS